MSIPGFQMIMLPLLSQIGDSKEHSKSELVESLAQHFRLTQDELGELLPSGQSPTFYNRVSWARFYLYKAGLVESTKKGTYRITKEGLRILATNPVDIDTDYLMQLEQFRAFKAPKPRPVSTSGSNVTRTSPDLPGGSETSPLTPVETFQAAYHEIMDSLAQEVLAKAKACSPAFFERLVVQLLVAMGYGGSVADAAQAVGKSGDGGIDGIIKEDPLGLDFIYIQAKRWENPVGSPEIQKFVGALHGKQARKGVFITTSKFTTDAYAFASMVDTKLALIDGEQLAKLMIERGVGVSKSELYELKRVDSDYFAEE